MSKFGRILLLISLLFNAYFLIGPYRDLIRQRDSLTESIKTEKSAVAGIHVNLGDINVEDLTKLQYFGKVIGSIFEQNSGKYSLYIKDLETDDFEYINPGEFFYSASLYKVPVAIAVMNDVTQENYSLDDELELKDYMKQSGSGDLNQIKEGEKLKIDMLIDALLKKSDNTAQVLLSQNLQNRSYLKLVDNINKSTPLLFAEIFEDLYKAIYFDETASKFLMDRMDETEFDDRIDNGISKEFNFYHKIGNWADSGSWHDCGVLVSEEYEFSICLMSKNTTYEEFMAASKGVGNAISVIFK